LTGPYRRNLAR